MSVARELTKVHQEFLRGTCGEVAARLSEPRGEFTVVVAPASKQVRQPAERPDDATLAGEFYRLTKAGATGSRRAALAAVAHTFGCSSRAVYAAVERAKGGRDAAGR